MQYPRNFDFNEKDGPELVSVFEKEGLDVEEEDDDEEVYRQEVRKLYAKIVRWQPDQAVQMIGATLGRLPGRLSESDFEVAEAALRLVFHFQEGLSSKMAKMIGNGGTFDQIVTALFESDIGFHSNHELLVLYLDIAVRYGKVLIAMKDESKKCVLIGRVYECIGRGIAGGRRRIRSRCCYLLLRFVKTMKGGGGNGIICSALSMVQGEHQRQLGAKRSATHDFFARYQRHLRRRESPSPRPYPHNVSLDRRHGKLILRKLRDTSELRLKALSYLFLTHKTTTSPQK
jgi:hypothetical protein